MLCQVCVCEVPLKSNSQNTFVIIGFTCPSINMHVTMSSDCGIYSPNDDDLLICCCTGVPRQVPHLDKARSMWASYGCNITVIYYHIHTVYGITPYTYMIYYIERA